MALYFYGERLRIPSVASVAIMVAFLIIWSLVQPIPTGIRPLIVAAFVFSFALRMPVIRLRSDMSYSVYLLHGPLLQTLILLGLFHDNLAFLAGVVCSVLGLSYVTEHLVERPGNALGHRLARRFRPRAAAVPRLA
jgi:peptidoglycan/LPS O-acetylase OafA/YrhL